MKAISRILPDERTRFIVLALLLFINSLVLETNEVVATSGFVSNVGITQLPWLWAADMLIVILTSGVYSLVVDRTKRERLAIVMSVSFSLVYVALYAMFRLGTPDWISYPLLTVVNDQQWLLFPMLIWSLANDMFSTAEAKRIFPLLGIAALFGGVTGNALTASVAQWLVRGPLGSLELLLSSAGLVLLITVVLIVAVRRIDFNTRQSRQEERVLDTLREGMAFVREVPAYRYLTLAMILLGVGFNVVEYQLIRTASQAYSQTTGLEAFYATMRAVRILVMVGVQGMLAGWLLNRMSFKSIFILMPAALFTGLLVMFFWPSLIGAVVGEYVARITLEGIDQPSRRAFLGLVPDERRGRVSAFMDGYLYPAGSIISCGIVGLTMLGVSRGLIADGIGRLLYFGVAVVCTAAAVWAIVLFRTHYDKSMLNWRLKRRQRKSILDDLDL